MITMALIVLVVIPVAKTTNLKQPSVQSTIQISAYAWDVYVDIYAPGPVGVSSGPVDVPEDAADPPGDAVDALDGALGMLGMRGGLLERDRDLYSSRRAFSASRSSALARSPSKPYR